MEQSINRNQASADIAYLGYRGAQNARHRWMFSLLLLPLSGAYLASYFYLDLVARDGVLTREECYALAFAYLAGVALLALVSGRLPLTSDRRLNCRLDNAWIMLPLIGAAMLTTLDAHITDASAYVVICLPLAVLHSAERTQLLALQGTGLVLTWCSVIAFETITGPPQIMFLLALAAISAAGAYLAIHLETARRQGFVSTHALEASNLALLERTAQLAQLNTELAERSRALETANQQLERLAMTDPLTGVANRRQLFEALDREFGRSRRYGNPLSIALLDLDDFGRTNKLHGVIAGDEVLAQFAASVRNQLRGVDMVARYGGEEFVVLMPDSSLPAAMQLLERMRQHICQESFSSRHIAITFSAGVATLTPEDSDPMNLLHRADESLRRAKQEGKNRVLADCS